MLKFCSNNDQKDVLNFSLTEPLQKQEQARHPILDDSTNVDVQSSSNAVEGHSSSPPPPMISPTSTITTPPFIVLSMSKLVFFTLLLFGAIHFFVLVRCKRNVQKINLVEFIYVLTRTLYHSLRCNVT